MKRDLDLVRSILLQVEAADGRLDIDCISTCGHNLHEVAYHVELMASQGLIDGHIIYAWGGEGISGHVSGLTWDGQDFLDAMRDSRVWDKAKKAIKEAVGSTTFDVVKATCSSVATALIRTNLGI